MAACYKCGKMITLGIEAPMPKEAVCAQCSSWLHSCANCASYDEYSGHKCRENKADFVFDRLGKNVCAFFKLKQNAAAQEQKKKFSPRSEQRGREGRARDSLEQLFRK
ncbi:MAG: hypothetical protein V1899_09735 [Planctomycetota bacterium]